MKKNAFAPLCTPTHYLLKLVRAMKNTYFSIVDRRGSGRAFSWSCDMCSRPALIKSHRAKEALSILWKKKQFVSVRKELLLKKSETRTEGWLTSDEFCGSTKLMSFCISCSSLSHLKKKNTSYVVNEQILKWREKNDQRQPADAVLPKEATNISHRESNTRSNNKNRGDTRT